MKIQFFPTLACLFVLVSSAGFAADEASAPGFGSKIDAWMEGTITSIEDDGKKFVVHGGARPYATQYAKMMKEIGEKTAKLSGAEATKTADEIRVSWAEKLNKAAAEAPSKESNFTFHVATKDGSLVCRDESASKLTIPEPTHKTQCTSMKDFSLNEFVVVGYESGVLRNDAFVVIKSNKPAETVPAGFKASEPKPSAVILDTETEQTLQIRRMIMDDKAMSTSARNVVIDMQKGVAHLKGSVESDAEKSSVENKAISVMGGANVKSELEVKTSK